MHWKNNKKYTIKKAMIWGSSLFYFSNGQTLVVFRLSFFWGKKEVLFV